MSEAGTATDTIVFWGAGTMRTLRPIWTAEELGVEYRLMPIGPRTGETKTPAYTRLNPKQKVPCMEQGELVLTESLVISRYLIDRYGTSETLASPRGAVARAQEAEWLSYLYGELDETSLYVMRRHRDLASVYGDAPAAVASSRDYAAGHFAVVAKALGERPFLLNDRLNLADILLVTCIDWALHYDFELPESLVRYRNELAARPAYRRAFDVNYRSTKEQR
ncbi:MAG: glutathione S-transferase family protein [Pseudomonadota bacterium]